jgi:hypothetical protein
MSNCKPCDLPGARSGEPREAETLADLPAGSLAATRHLVAHLQPSAITYSSAPRGVASSCPKSCSLILSQEL